MNSQIGADMQPSYEIIEDDRAGIIRVVVKGFFDS
jgi:hypothetical protein